MVIRRPAMLPRAALGRTGLEVALLGFGAEAIGRKGRSFDDARKTLEAVHADVSKLKSIKRPIAEKPLDDKETTWVEPRLWCEVQYASLTPNGTLREPVFLRMRPDLE